MTKKYSDLNHEEIFNDEKIVTYRKKDGKDKNDDTIIKKYSIATDHYKKTNLKLKKVIYEIKR